MMKKCLCLIIYTIAFLSCTSKDGDWEPMEWEVDTSAYLKKDHIAVPESGGTYTLFCNNYARKFPLIDVISLPALKLAQCDKADTGFLGTLLPGEPVG